MLKYIGVKLGTGLFKVILPILKGFPRPFTSSVHVSSTTKDKGDKIRGKSMNKSSKKKKKSVL